MSLTVWAVSKLRLSYESMVSPATVYDYHLADKRLETLKVQEIPSGYEIVINGGRTRMGLDAIEWARRGEELGAGELVVNSIDADGTKEGYELTLTRMIAEAVTIPVIASGGGGELEHLYDVLTEGKADAALMASMLHYGEYTVGEIKSYLAGRGIKIRQVGRCTSWI